MYLADCRILNEEHFDGGPALHHLHRLRAQNSATCTCAHYNGVKSHAVHRTCVHISRPLCDAVQAEYMLAALWRADLLVCEPQQANGAFIRVSLRAI